MIRMISLADRSWPWRWRMMSPIGPVQPVWCQAPSAAPLSP
jgi:hypothetical protein